MQINMRKGKKSIFDMILSWKLGILESFYNIIGRYKNQHRTSKSHIGINIKA